MESSSFRENALRSSFVNTMLCRCIHYYERFLFCQYRKRYRGLLPTCSATHGITLFLHLSGILNVCSRYNAYSDLQEIFFLT